VARQTSQKRQQPSEEKNWGEPPFGDRRGRGFPWRWSVASSRGTRHTAIARVSDRLWRPPRPPSRDLCIGGDRRGAQAFLPNKAIFPTKSGNTTTSGKSGGSRGYIFMCRNTSAERCTGVSAKQSHFPRGVHAVLTSARPPEGGTRAPASVRGQRGGSPLQAYALRPVTDCNCVAARRGGEQQEVKDQSVG